MAQEIIDGRKIAADIREELKSRIVTLKEKGVTPGLAAVLIGEDPGSLSYLRSIAKGCDEVGIYTETISIPDDASQKILEEELEILNHDPRFHGIILQLPLPKHLNTLRAESIISPEKDIDGTNPISAGKLLLGEDTFLPSTPSGVQELLIRSGHNPEGKHVVICGRSNIVGKPLMGILMQKKSGANATVTVCHTGTKNLSLLTRQADIIVAAMGKARAITGDMVSKGTVVVDVGVNRVQDSDTGKFRLVGDVDFDAVKDIAEAITPVPGGTGPVTSAMLLSNTVRAAEKLSS